MSLHLKKKKNSFVFGRSPPTPLDNYTLLFVKRVERNPVSHITDFRRIIPTTDFETIILLNFLKGFF